MCGSNVQFQEAEPVVSSIKERIEPVWATLWTEEALCQGWRFCVVGQRDLVAQLDREGRSRELISKFRKFPSSIMSSQNALQTVVVVMNWSPHFRSTYNARYC